MIHGAASAARPPSPQPSYQFFHFNLDIDHMINGQSHFLHHPFQRVGLDDGSRETIQKESPPAIPLPDPFFHNPDNHFIRNEFSPNHIGLGLEAQNRPLIYRLPKDIAC